MPLKMQGGNDEHGSSELLAKDGKRRRFLYVVIAILFMWGLGATTVAAVLGIRAMTGHRSVEWEAWKRQYGKYYPTAQAEQAAYERFLEVDAKIATHNAKGLPYTLKHNEFSDKQWSDFHTPGVKGKQTSPLKTYNGSIHASVGRSLQSLPSSKDWVAEGAVTAVKNQGNCGSCWTFAASGALEGAYAISSGYLVSLSEQYLLDCTYDQDIMDGCGGGNVADAIGWTSTYGETTAESYPYTSGESHTRGQCSSAEDVPYVKVDKYHQPSDEAQLLEAVATVGPVAVTINTNCCPSSDVFQNYNDGILMNYNGMSADIKNYNDAGRRLDQWDTPTVTGCNEPDHAVLVVGYGTATLADGSSVDYWKVRPPPLVIVRTCFFARSPQGI